MTSDSSISHPEAHLLAAFVEGNASTPDVQAIANHLRTCEECREVVGVAAEFAREETSFAAPRRKWFLAAAAALMLVVAAAAAVQIALRARNPIAEMSAAAVTLQTRPVPSRISGFEWAAPPTTVRGDSPTPETQLLKLRGIAGTAIADLAGRSDPASVHARSVALLIAGDGKSAIEGLELTVAAEPRNATYWNDLAAARLAYAMAIGDTEGLALALAAADRAVAIDPKAAAPRFNRALALESLKLRPQAVSALEDFLRLDASSPWAAEARERLSRLRDRTSTIEWKRAIPALVAAAEALDGAAVERVVRQFPQQARTWGETELLGEWGDALTRGDHPRAASSLGLAGAVGQAFVRTSKEQLLSDAVKSAAATASLAQAHAGYRAARLLYARRDVAAAFSLLQTVRPAFMAAASPMRFVAAYYAANMLTDLGRLDEASRVLDEASAAPQEYLALHAQIQWQRATIASRRGHYIEAAATYETAASAFQRLGEAENASSMKLAAATCAATMGRFSEAWRALLPVFETASNSGDGSHVQHVLTAVARWEARRGQWNIVRSLTLLASSSEVESTNRRLHTDALVWLARANHEIGAPEDRDEALARAETSARSIPDERLRRDAGADVSMSRAAALLNTEPTRSRELTTIAVTTFEATGERHRLIDALFYRARAERRLGSHEAARSDLERSVDLIEQSGALVSDRGGRAAFAAARRSVFDELVDLLESEGRHSRAFEVAESSRAYAQPESRAAVPPLAVEEIRRALPEDATIVAFYSLPDRLLVDVVSRDELRHVVVPVGRGELGRKVDRFLRAVIESGKITDDLFDVTLRPADVAKSRRVAIVPDGPLWQVPFSALKDNEDHYVVEHSSVVLAASARQYVDPTTRASRRAVAHAVIVRGSDEGMAALPSADEEVRSVAALVSNPLTLMGRDASPSAVLDQLQQSSHFHFSGHAVINELDAGLSYLRLTETDGSAGALYVRDIIRQSTPRLRIAYLAGCQTAVAAGRDARRESLVSAFLAAGATNAVGSLWKIDDAVAAEFTKRFYAALNEGRDVTTAVNEVQLAMLNSGDRRMASASAWAAMQVYGARN
jgi:tetratricopeptide (TPR) repeat protein